jgi:cbb3-type cytochrome oxidase maturation protein
MLVSVYFLIFLSITMGVLFASAFVWASKTNQFKNIEEAKFQMMRDEE